MKIVNPATEEMIEEIAEDNRFTLSNKFQLLKTGLHPWQEVPLAERVEVIRRFSALLEANMERLAAILTSEVGKPLQQSRNELKGAITRIQWLAQNAEKYLKEEWMASGNSMEEMFVYEPLGVVCNISAWNYPYLVGVNVFVPALIAGNAVMYKPSEFATLSGMEVDKLLKEAGIPDPVFQPAIGGGAVGEALMHIPFDGYFFTGSYKTGKTVYEKASLKMVPCQCELGGKDPLYVTDDVSDIRAVALATAEGAFYNSGQSCCSVERIYVHEKIYDEYVNAFVHEVKSWKMGLPTGDGVFIGPLTRKEQLAVLDQQVREAVRKGAVILTGGKRPAHRGYYFEPTVLVNVTNDMSLMQEESFGPMIGIMKVRDDGEAVKWMQDTAYGLTASVYSGNRQRAEAILQQLDVGTCYWNCCDRVSAALPWSGRKHSGIGATLSYIGLRAFTRTRAYHFRNPG
jgi:acyl-CoA reductase-like NAD-dependent aldehyde dehydrogenase